MLQTCINGNLEPIYIITFVMRDKPLGMFGILTRKTIHLATQVCTIAISIPRDKNITL